MPFIASLTTLLILPANAVIQDQPCDTYSWTGEDDNAHQMNLTNPLTLGDITYETTYVTTNGTLTFGTPDANFSSYPNTPSISLAGYDWVTFGDSAKLSYGSTDTGFCVEWKVRPYPQSTGDLTTIKLTVDTSRLPSWSGIVETTGWLPADLRRGIRFTSGQDVVTISEAFSINGGVPVEMQTCWDNSIIPLTSNCPAEPPPGQCWDGSTVPWNGTCPPVPPDTQCWDGSWVTWSQTCPPQPPPITCWDSSIIPYNATCPPTPPDIVCWNNEVVSWNQTCPQVPPPIECWDGSEVNWSEQCPPEPPIITYPDDAIYITVNENDKINYVTPTGMKINQILFASYGTPNNYQYGFCHATSSLTLVETNINNNELIIDATNNVFGDPCGGTGKQLSVVLTIEVDPTYIAPTPSPTPQPSESQTPTLEPSPQPSEPSPQPSETFEPPLEPSPTPTPSESESVVPEPEPSQTQSPEPEPSSPLEPTPSPEQSLTPDPAPEATDIPSNNDIIDAAVEDAVSDGSISDADTQEIIGDLLSDGDISNEEVTNLSDSLISDGVLTQDDKELLADILVAQAEGEAISSEMIDELGLDYEDLPDDQPVSLDNGVILFAEVADALEIFENPSEILGAVFTDPEKALTAIANVGADMTPEKREESQKVIVASVIAAQVLSTTSVIGRIR